MKEATLRDLARRYLLPFFSGAVLEEESRPSTIYQSKVSFINPCSIAFKVRANDAYRLVITRAHPFIRSQSARIPEKKIVDAFVKTLYEMRDVIDGDYQAEILSGLQRRVVARSLLDGKGEAAILNSIDQLTMWGQRLYEGAPISAAFGLRSTAAPEPFITLDDFASKDFSAVLTNGYDTLASFNYRGQFLAHESLSLSEQPSSFCPIRQAQIAEWSGGHVGRVAFSLNRLGEILVFDGEKLMFAQRSGRWSFLTHEAIISQMNIPHNVALRTKIYETCLDASFARTGACIGVVAHANKNSWTEIVNAQDRLAGGQSLKIRTLRRIIGAKRFGDLDRRLRQEITAIDGATLLSHDGRILAAGAILNIDGGSPGGGRLAAARTMAKFGVGIKVSQDGGISGYRGEDDEPKFRVM